MDEDFQHYQRARREFEIEARKMMSEWAMSGDVDALSVGTVRALTDGVIALVNGCTRRTWDLARDIQKIGKPE